MIEALSLEELGRGIGRGFFIALMVLIALGVLKGFLLPILSSWVVALKHMIGWLVIIVLAIIAAMF
jgi:hypothetical protein